MGKPRFKFEDLTFFVRLEDPETGNLHEIAIPFYLFLAVHRVVKQGKRGGIDARFIAFFGAYLQIFLDLRKGQPYEDTSTLEKEAGQRLEHYSQQIGQIIYDLEVTAKEHFKDDEDLLLRATYTMLKNGFMSRSEAVDFANQMLGKNFTTDAWRKRVDRWAEHEGLPKVEQYKRIGSDTSSENVQTD